MKTLRKCVLLMLIVVIGSGCASSKKITPVGNLEKKQNQRVNEILENVDNNTAKIRESQNELSEIAGRLSNLENKLNTALTDNNATAQEIKENLAFMNDQILRIDKTISSKRPVPRPKAASVFKPGGFDVGASYKGALEEYYSKRYESAISGFTEVLTVTPQNPLADNAQYWIGECYYGMGNYERALDAFYKVLDFTESNKLSDTNYKIGKTYLMMENTDSAKEQFEAVIQNYPGTSASNYAAQELKKMGE